jgi:hypothetical protein
VDELEDRHRSLFQGPAFAITPTTTIAAGKEIQRDQCTHPLE